MTTSSQIIEVPESFAPSCPEWCELRAGHGVDAIHGEDGDRSARRSRCHGGPRFGEYLSAYAEEFTDAPGALVVGIHFSIEDDGVDLTDPAQLEALQKNVQAAQEWLAAHENNVTSEASA